MLLACCVRLPLPAGHVSQRIIVLFGKHDDLQVGSNVLSCSLRVLWPAECDIVTCISVDDCVSK